MACSVRASSIKTTKVRTWINPKSNRVGYDYLAVSLSNSIVYVPVGGWWGVVGVWIARRSVGREGGGPNRIALQTSRTPCHPFPLSQPILPFPVWSRHDLTGQITQQRERDAAQHNTTLDTRPRPAAHPCSAGPLATGRWSPIPSRGNSLGPLRPCTA